MVNKYKEEDIESIYKLGCKLNPSFQKLYDLKSLNENEEIYVYKKNNEVVGFIHIYKGLDVTDILNIIVDEKYQKQGIGYELIQHIINNSSNRIMLEVSEKSEAAIKLYKKLDFIIISKRKNYYDNSDALIMERK